MKLYNWNFLGDSFARIYFRNCLNNEESDDPVHGATLTAPVEGTSKNFKKSLT